MFSIWDLSIISTWAVPLSPSLPLTAHIAGLVGLDCTPHPPLSLMTIPQSWNLLYHGIPRAAEAVPSPVAFPGLSSGTLTLSHSAKPQLLSMTPSILPRLHLQNQHHVGDSCALSSSSFTWKCSPGFQRPQALCVNTEKTCSEWPSEEQMISSNDLLLATADSLAPGDQHTQNHKILAKILHR